MGRYADLVCTQCDVRLWLGKAVWDHEPDQCDEEVDFCQPAWFHRGDADRPHWARNELNAVLWKMLADHSGHPLKVIVDGDLDDRSSDETVEVGGDTFQDISFTEYLKDWPGLMQHDL
jgi:hypothetical protein